MLLPALSYEINDAIGGGAILPTPAFPVAAFSFTGDELAVDFADESGGGPDRWLWDFGDGTFSYAQHPTHVFAVEGAYQVKLTVTTPAGLSLTISQEVTVPIIATLSARIADRAGKALVLPPGTYELDAAVADRSTQIVLQHGAVITVPVSRELASRIDFSQGGQIKPAAGVVVTLSGIVNIPPLHHAFDLSDGGTVIGTTDTGCTRLSICNFADHYSETDWRLALVSAHAFVESCGPGGTLLFPARSSTYDCDFTGESPLHWTQDSVWWEGDGVGVSEIVNVATDGTGFIEFDGVTNSIQWAGFRKLKLTGESDSGLMLGFLSKGLSYTIWDHTHVHQQNPAARILDGTFVNTGGMFECFLSGHWEHGTTLAPATVSAWRISANKNLFTVMKWGESARFQLHKSEVPFFDLDCSSAGAYFHQIEFDGINIEQCKGGFFKGRGIMDLIVRNVTMYDSDDLTGHIWDIGDGSGGRESSACKFENYRPISGDLLGVTGTDKVGAITASAGDVRTLGGAGMVAHGLSLGQGVYLEGAIAGRFAIVAKTNDTIDVTSAGAPGSGAVTVWEAALDVKVSGTANGTRFVDTYGTGSRQFEAGLSNRPVDRRGSTSFATYYRANETQSIEGVTGAGAKFAAPALQTDSLAARTSGGTIPVTSPLQPTGGLIIGAGQDSGDALTKCIKVDVAAVDWSSVPGAIAAGAFGTKDITVAGAAVGDRVSWSVVVTGSNPLGTGVVIHPPVIIATDTVRLTVQNTTGAPITPTTRTWRFTMWSHV